MAPSPTRPASGTRADAFTWDADARPLTDFTGDTGAGDNGLWTATPPYQWSQDPARHAVAYVTEPLSADTTAVGAGRVDLWVRSSAPNVDLQVTISEVRPDGKETFVQNGWVRTIARALDEAKSTELEPVLSLREEDFAPMPADQFVPVTVPLYYEGHAYRAGSRIRVRVSAPNGDQPIWSFSETEPAGTAEVEIGYGDGMPSRLVLPQVPGVDVPDQLPPCPGLRGEPCRDYVPFENDTSVLDGYPRPGGATPLRVPLVPAYQSCSAPNSTHGAPLSFPSCNPPDLESQVLTVGTPDSNGKASEVDRQRALRRHHRRPGNLRGRGRRGDRREPHRRPPPKSTLPTTAASSRPTPPCGSPTGKAAPRATSRPRSAISPSR